MTPFLKNILFAIIAAIILWFGYQMFFASNDVTLSSDTRAISQASRDTQDFLRALQQLRGLQLDNTLFTDPRFQSFIDYRQAIVPEPVGRPNPFAPIGH